MFSEEKQAMTIQNDRRHRWLDLIRFIAAFLVYYGHMVSVATYAPSIPEAISESNSSLLPMLPSETHVMDELEYLLSHFLFAQTAVIGVCLFFLLAGYLSVDSKKRYTTRQFLFGRAVRLLPVLWIVTIICGVTLHYVQGIDFKPIEYIAQMTLTSPLIGIRGIVAGVVWTLYTEVIYYLIISIPKHLDLWFIAIFDAIIVFFIFAWHLTGSGNLLQIVYFLKYIPIIFIGAVIKMTEDKNTPKCRVCIIGLFSAIAWGILQLNKQLNGDGTTYPNLSTGVLALFVFCLIYVLARKSSFENKIPHFITFFSSINYTFYLSQVCIGFNLMFLLKKHITTNAYLIEVLTLVMLIVLSVSVHYLIEKPATKYGKELQNKLQL